MTGIVVIRRTITVAPGTRLALVQHSRTPVAAGWPGGYVESPLSLDQLHPGEFATVTTEEHAGRSVALAVDVVPRPSALPTR